MSKTLGSIVAAGLTIAGTVAGVVVGTIVAGPIGGAIGGAIGGSLGNIAGTAAAKAIVKAPKADTTFTALRTERPPRVSAYGRLKLFGAQALYETAPDGSAIDVWAFHEGQIDGIEGWYLGDTKVVRLDSGFVQKGEDGRWGDSDTVQIGANLGLPTETAHALVIAKLPGIWTADHRGDGVASGYMISKAVKTKNYQEIYATGGPNATPLAIVMRAQLVFDWRDESQSIDDPTTWKWSENAVLHTAHYELVRNGKTWARHFAPTLGFWTAAADDADVAMPLKAGGTEPRYRSCVSHKHAGNDSEHKQVLTALLSTFDGWLAPRQDGALIVYSGRYYEPTVHIGPDQIIGYTIDDGIDDEDAVNQLKVTYVSADHDFNTVDTDDWLDEDDILARGVVRSDDMGDQVPSHAQARRLAKRRMAKTSAPKRGTVTLNADGEAALGERFVALHLVEGEGDDAFAPFDGPVEVTSIRRDPVTGVMALEWIAADPNVDAWNPATEEGDPAPTGDRVAREPLVLPTIETAAADYGADSGSGAVGVFLRLTVAGLNRDDVTWFVRTREQGAVVWGEREYTDIDPDVAVELVTEFVPADTNVEAEAAYRVGDGRVSPWSDTATVNTSTANLAPKPATELTATGGAGAAHLTWRNPASSNLAYLRVYRGTTTTFSAATQIGSDLVGGLGQVMTYDDTAAAGTYRYWVRAFNAANVGSTPTGPQSATVT